jgi:hypothetical protein
VTQRCRLKSMEPLISETISNMGARRREPDICGAKVLRDFDGGPDPGIGEIDPGLRPGFKLEKSRSLVDGAEHDGRGDDMPFASANGDFLRRCRRPKCARASPNHGPCDADDRLARSLLRPAGRSRLSRHPLRQSRHRPDDENRERAEGRHPSRLPARARRPAGARALQSR